MGWIIAAVIVGFLVARNIYELQHIKTSKYEICSGKINPENNMRIVFLSDLHSRRYGEANENLVRLIRKQQPDLILLGGDMTIDSPKKNEEVLFELLEALPDIAPVCYAPGNHERVLMENNRFESDRFAGILKKCEECGILFLSNETVTFRREKDGTGRFGSEENDGIAITGFDPEYEFYDKRIRRKLKAEEIAERVGDIDRNCFQLLLAHDPGPFEEYVKYGADLVLAGHYHGGAIRFGKAGLVSPQVRFFPRFSAGLFKKEQTTMIVTRGAGSHSVNLRLFNYPEIVVIDLSGNCSD